MIEKSLIEKLASSDESERLNSARALGHVGSSDGAAALRKFVEENQGGSLRVAMAAMRSLGYLGDAGAVPLLTEILRANMNKDPGASPDLHELGWLQKPVYLTATAAEALGRIGGDEAISSLAEAMPKLLDFWKYTFWCGDHSWLMGCNSSPIHYRMIEAFDRGPTKIPRPTVLSMLKSVPIDKDRALLFESDSYEYLVGRVVAGSGMADDIIETCLSVLGDPNAKWIRDVNEAVTASAPAVSVGPHDPQSRAAQIASVVCLDKRYAERFCEVLDRYRKIEPSEEKSWVCFYVARLLGRLGGDDSVRSLVAALANDKKEAEFGYEDPPNVFVYKARTPFYRAAAAFSLGCIGDPGAVDVLMEVVTDFDNAVSVRNAAAESLIRLKAHTPSKKLREIAQSYPEISTQRLLFEACSVELSGK
jgi:HEAT repeat protein